MTTQELIDKTQELMAIRSTGDNPAALKQVVDYVHDIVAARPDITIERFEHNGKHSFLAYQGKNRPEKFDVLLNAHLDVVPASPDNFKPEIKNGRLHGRGSLDMKGTALVLTDVFCEMVNEVPYSLGLQIVSDEEIGGYSGTRLHIDDGLRAEFVIMGEYSVERNTIYNAARGLCWAEIAFKGREAHGGYLWSGDNAVVRAGNFAGAVLKRYPTPTKETWTSTASIASLYTPNETYNKVPDRAVLKIDFRFTQEDPVFVSEDSVRAFIASIDPDAELLNIAVFEPAVNVAELNPHVQGLSQAMRKVTKKEPQFRGRPGGSDGRHYSLTNIDNVEFGLYGAHPHTDKEYVELSSFQEYKDIMLAFLAKPIPSKPKQEPAESLQMRLLEQLVSFPTISGDFHPNNGAFAFIEDFLKKRGMHIERFEYNKFRSIVATTKKGNKRPTVMLNAHLDVVPAANDFYTVTRKGDKLYGRGVMDMKFAIASYMSLVDKLRNELDSYDFGIMITSDEEVGSENGTIRLLSDVGYKPDVVLIPDSGENWRLETFAKGIHWIKLSAKGKAAHASRQWEGDSAIRRLLGALSEVEMLIPPDAGPEDTTLSVGTIDGGTTANQIPTDASAVLDIRYGNMDDYEHLFPRIEKVCQKHGVKATVLAIGQPSVNDPNDQFIKPFVDIVNGVTGQKHGTSLSYGVTDGRHFSAAGIPCIVIQPPAGDRHKDTEWLSKKGFDQFGRILEQYVRQLAVTAPSEEKTKEEDVSLLAQRLNVGSSPAYVWYATFGSGLYKDNFMSGIKGGKLDGAKRPYTGCRDKSAPLKDMFISLPHELSFSGSSYMWLDGGHATLDVRKSSKAHTIARAYLITIEQFEDLAAQENGQTEAVRLPLSKAIRSGHATIGNIKGARVYDELLYCGQQDRIPIFSLTNIGPRGPFSSPSPEYTRALCKGLSQNPVLDIQAVIDYVVNKPGIAGHYDEDDVIRLADEAAQTDELPASGH